MQTNGTDKKGVKSLKETKQSILFQEFKQDSRFHSTSFSFFHLLRTRWEHEPASLPFICANILIETVTMAHVQQCHFLC